MLLLRKCGTCSSQMIHSTHIYCSVHSVPRYQHFRTQQTPDIQSRHLKSVFHFLRQCIYEQEGTCIMWWKCSTHYCGINFLAIVLYDEEIGAEYLNVKDVACGTNILTRLVELVRYLQVGGGVVVCLTVPLLSRSTFKKNSKQRLKNTMWKKPSTVTWNSSRIEQYVNIY